MAISGKMLDVAIDQWGFYDKIVQYNEPSLHVWLK